MKKSGVVDRCHLKYFRRENENLLGLEGREHMREGRKEGTKGEGEVYSIFMNAP